SWRDPLLGALRVIQGPGTPVPPAEEIGRIPFSMPRSATPVEVYQRYLTAAASVARVLHAERQPAFVSTGWLLSARLVVIPAHIIIFGKPGGLKDRLTPPEIEASASQWLVEFEGPGARSHRVVKVEGWSERLDLALLRLDRAADAAPLSISPSV